MELEGAGAKAYQIQSRVRAMRMAWEALFINGDSNQSPSEFDGLAARIGAGSSQYFANGGGALDLGKLDEVIDNVDAQGGQKYIVCSKSARRALTKQARESGQIEIARSEFGYQQTSYMGLPLLELDRDHKNVAILDSDLCSGPLRCLLRQRALTGIQNGGVGVRELGESHEQPQLITRVVLWPGSDQRPRCCPSGWHRRYRLILGNQLNRVKGPLGLFLVFGYYRMKGLALILSTRRLPNNNLYLSI